MMTQPVRWLLALFGLCLLGFSALAAAQQSLPVPPLKSRVTDLAGLLQPAQASRLELQLAALETRKGAQLAILILPSTGDESIEQYSLRVAETWQLGRGTVDGKAVDDGVLLLVATKDRKIRLEVGYGLEGAIPDAYAKRIIADQISPAFRQGDYAGGLNAAVVSLTALIDGEALPAPKTGSRAQSSENNYWGPIFIGFVVGVLVMGLAGRTLGLVAGVGASFILSLLMSAVLLEIVFNGVGTAVMLSMFGGRSRMRKVGRHTYRSGPPVMLPGGFAGGGSSRGGGGGFGGFGGGGGGGFGGGGASGGW